VGREPPSQEVRWPRSKERIWTATVAVPALFPRD
jgi:hypothetical protein